MFGSLPTMQTNFNLSLYSWLFLSFHSDRLLFWTQWGRPMAISPSEFVCHTLETLGLPASALKADVIEDSGSDRIVIGDDLTAAPFPVQTVETKSLAQIKSWIGNSDAAVSKNKIELAAPVNLSAVSADTDDLEDLASAARQFVFGDSAAASHLTSAIESKLGPFQLHVLAANVIRIKPGQTLVFEGSVPKVVTADELIFEGAGSNIESFVNLSMKVKNVIVK